MLVFSRVPEPSSLLWTNDLKRAAKTLLAQCEDPVLLDHPGSINLLWQHAQNLDAQGDSEGCAVVSIRLAEIFRDCGRLGPAWKCAERAREIMTRWPHKHQKQNLAVALYCCGLIQQALGSYQEACERYEEARSALREARAQRQTLGSSPEFEKRCTTAEHSIEELSEYVTEARTCGDSGALQFCCLMDYWLAERNPREDVRPEVSVALRMVEVGMELQVGPETYKLEGLDGSKTLKLVPQPDKEYRIVKVPEEMSQLSSQAQSSSQSPSQLQGAKYALVWESLHAGRFGIGTQRSEGNALLWGDFVRDPVSTKISLSGIYQDQFLLWPKLVGEDDLNLDGSGTIVGIFK